MHETNVYEELEEQPQVCAFNMIPYEAQPPAPIIGKFKIYKKNDPVEYERTLLTRQVMGNEEENFIQNLLEEGLR